MNLEAIETTLGEEYHRASVMHFSCFPCCKGNTIAFTRQVPTRMKKPEPKKTTSIRNTRIHLQGVLYIMRTMCPFASKRPKPAAPTSERHFPMPDHRRVHTSDSMFARLLIVLFSSAVSRYPVSVRGNSGCSLFNWCNGHGTCDTSTST